MYHANMIKKIATDWPLGIRTRPFGGRAGIQVGLDALAKTSEFTQALEEEIAARHLAPGDVIPCIPSIYQQASRRPSSNDSIITIYKEDHSMQERAVLAAFLKMQGGWPNGLEWREVERRWGGN